MRLRSMRVNGKSQADWEASVQPICPCMCLRSLAKEDELVTNSRMCPLPYPLHDVVRHSKRNWLNEGL